MRILSETTEFLLAAFNAAIEEGGSGRRARGFGPAQAVIPRACGGSSTPRLLGSIINVSGILGRPVKPGDDEL
jgi:hypothetical protein